MENCYSYSSSAASSPRSRDLDDENPNPKVKFLCSYNGQIQPRPHDPTHRLTYVGGDTKILSVDRHVTFSSFSSKLSSLSGQENSLSIKYQLPGEDLDGLISVTNDEDLVNLMAEYDRVLPRPARMRLFLFPPAEEAEGRWFADALSGVKEGLNNNNNNNNNDNNDINSDISGSSNADFLFGLDGNNNDAAAKEECHVIGETVGAPRAYAGGDYYGVPMTVPQQYWQERQVATGGLPEQPVYLIQTPSGVYQSAAPLRPMTGQFPSQGYYGMQPIYNHAPQPLIQQGVFRGQAVEQGYAAYDLASRQQGMVQGQAAYDVAGRQVYYSTGVPAQGVTPQYQAVAVASTAAQDSGNIVVVSKAI